MEEHRHEFNLGRMAKLLKVSRSGYYKYLSSKDSKDKDLRILTEIRAIYRSSRGTYGCPRIHAELRSRGEKINRKRIERLMRVHNIKAKKKGGYKIKPKPSEVEVKANLINQDFSCNTPNEKWASDISYIPTSLGWVYLAVILDLYSRKVIGMALSAKIDTALVLIALKQAIARRGISPDLIFHSDRGSQYTAYDIQTFLVLVKIKASMSAKGNCFDNAAVESFFGTLKTELDMNYYDLDEAKTAIFEYIECWYNNNRRHSSLGYLSSKEFEDRYYHHCSHP